MTYYSEVIIREVQWRVYQLIHDLAIVPNSEVAVGLLGATLLELELRRHNIDHDLWRASLKGDVSVIQLSAVNVDFSYDRIATDLKAEFEN